MTDSVLCQSNIFYMSLQDDPLSQILDFVEKTSGIRLDPSRFTFTPSAPRNKSFNTELRIRKKDNLLPVLDYSFEYNRYDLAVLFKDLVVLESEVRDLFSLYGMLELLKTKLNRLLKTKNPIRIKTEDLIDSAVRTTEVDGEQVQILDIWSTKNSLLLTGHVSLRFRKVTTIAKHKVPKRIVFATNETSYRKKVMALDLNGNPCPDFDFCRNVIDDPSFDFKFEINDIIEVSKSDFMLLGDFRFTYTRLGSGAEIGILAATAILCDRFGYVSAPSIASPFNGINLPDVILTKPTTNKRYCLDKFTEAINVYDRSGYLVMTRMLYDLDLNYQEIRDITVVETENGDLICLKLKNTTGDFVLVILNEDLKPVTRQLVINSQNIDDVVPRITDDDGRYEIQTRIIIKDPTKRLETITLSDGVESFTFSSVFPVFPVLTITFRPDVTNIDSGLFSLSEFSCIELKGYDNEKLNKAFGTSGKPSIILDMKESEENTGDRLLISYQRTPEFLNTPELSFAVFNKKSDRLLLNEENRNSSFRIKEVYQTKQLSSDSVLLLVKLDTGDITSGFTENPDFPFFVKVTGTNLKPEVLVLGGRSGIELTKRVVLLGE